MIRIFGDPRSGSAFEMFEEKVPVHKFLLAFLPFKIKPWIRIRIRILFGSAFVFTTLDMDPHEMDADPKPCYVESPML